MRSCANCGSHLDANGKAPEDDGDPVALRIGELGIPVIVRANGRGMVGRDARTWVPGSEEMQEALKRGDIRKLSRSLTRLVKTTTAGTDATDEYGDGEDTHWIGAERKVWPAEDVSYAKEQDRSVYDWTAGMVAFCGRGPQQSVCLVEKRDGCLGFPKGAAQDGDSSPMATARRKWQEETGMPLEALVCDEGQNFDDIWGCHHFVGDYVSSGHRLFNTCGQVREQSKTDFAIRVHWMSCEDALSHPQLSQDRRNILRQAQKYLSCSLWLAKGCEKTCV